MITHKYDVKTLPSECLSSERFFKPQVDYAGGTVCIRPSFCPVVIAIDTLVVHNGKGQSSHVIFCGLC